MLCDEASCDRTGCDPRKCVRLSEEELLSYPDKHTAGSVIGDANIDAYIDQQKAMWEMELDATHRTFVSIDFLEDDGTIRRSAEEGDHDSDFYESQTMGVLANGSHVAVTSRGVAWWRQTVDGIRGYHERKHVRALLENPNRHNHNDSRGHVPAGADRSICDQPFKCRVRATVHTCPPGACEQGGTCAEGRTGVVCAICLEGYALSGNTCGACNEVSDSGRITILTIMIGIIFALWVAILWRPLWTVPMDEDAEYFEQEKRQAHLAAIAAGQVAAGPFHKRLWMVIMSTFKPYIESLLQAGIRNVFKIGFSFFQILGSFPSTFTVKWPATIQIVFDTTNSVVFLDLIGLLGIGCFVGGLDYGGRLNVYTIGGLLVIAFIMAPATIVGIYTWIQGRGFTGHPRHSNMMDSAWWALTLWIFVSYPTLSMRVLETFNCDDQLELLMADFNEKCPNLDLGYLFLYSMVFSGIYPLGIPLFLTRTLYAYQVPRMARHKINTALLDAMIIRFKKMTTSKESEVVSKIIGNMTDPLFEKRVMLLFEKIDVEHTGEINMVTMVQALKDMGLSKVTEKTMRMLKRRFGARGDKTLLPMDLLELIKEMAGSRLLFHGHEHLDELTTAQMKALCSHNWGKAAVGLQSAASQDVQMQFVRTRTGRIVQKAVRTKHGSREHSRERRHSHSSTGGSETTSVANSRRNSVASESPHRLKKSHKIQRGRSFFKFVRTNTWGLGYDNDAPDDNGDSFYHVDNANDDEMRVWIMEKASDLLRENLITMPFIYWDGSSEEERQAIARVGPIFMAFKVKYWYFELFEMGRKLTMTSVMAFLLHGSAAQVAVGFLVLWASMQYTLQAMPYALSMLNGMQIYALLAQCITLFYGLMVIAEGETTVEVEILPIMVLIIDFSVLLYPFLHWIPGSSYAKNLRHRFRRFRAWLTWPSWMPRIVPKQHSLAFKPFDSGGRRLSATSKLRSRGGSTHENTTAEPSDGEHEDKHHRFDGIVDTSIEDVLRPSVFDSDEDNESHAPSRFKNSIFDDDNKDNGSSLWGTGGRNIIGFRSSLLGLGENPADLNKLSRAASVLPSSDQTEMSGAAVPYLTAQLTLAQFSKRKGDGSGSSDSSDSSSSSSSYDSSDSSVTAKGVKKHKGSSDSSDDDSTSDSDDVQEGVPIKALSSNQNSTDGDSAPDSSGNPYATAKLIRAPPPLTDGRRRSSASSKEKLPFIKPDDDDDTFISSQADSRIFDFPTAGAGTSLGFLPTDETGAPSLSREDKLPVLQGTFTGKLAPVPESASNSAVFLKPQDDEDDSPMRFIPAMKQGRAAPAAGSSVRGAVEALLDDDDDRLPDPAGGGGGGPTLDQIAARRQAAANKRASSVTSSTAGGKPQGILKSSAMSTSSSLSTGSRRGPKLPQRSSLKKRPEFVPVQEVKRLPPVRESLKPPGASTAESVTSTTAPSVTRQLSVTRAITPAAQPMKLFGKEVNTSGSAAAASPPRASSPPPGDQLRSASPDSVIMEEDEDDFERSTSTGNQAPEGIQGPRGEMPAPARTFREQEIELDPTKAVQRVEEVAIATPQPATAKRTVSVTRSTVKQLPSKVAATALNRQKSATKPAIEEEAGGDPAKKRRGSDENDTDKYVSLQHLFVEPGGGGGDAQMEEAGAPLGFIDEPAAKKDRRVMINEPTVSSMQPDEGGAAAGGVGGASRSRASALSGADAALREMDRWSASKKQAQKRAASQTREAEGKSKKDKRFNS